MSRISVLIAEALQHIQRADLGAAKVACHRVLKLRSNQPDALHLLGAIALRGNDLPTAVDWLKQAVAAAGRNATYWNTLGVAMHGMNQVGDAIECFRKSLALSPKFAEAENNLGNALKDQGHWAESVESYKRAVALRPDYPDAWNNLGNAQTVLKDLPSAFQSLLRAIELRPTYAEAHYNLGRALQEAGNRRDAIASFQRAVELSPKYAEAWNCLGMCHQGGNEDEAVRCYREAILHRPTYPEAHNNLGNVLQTQGYLNDASRCFELALNLRPGFVEATLNLGNLIREQGDLARAIEHYHEAIRLDPRLAEAYNNLGVAHKQLKETAVAATAYRAAIELKPDYAEAHFNLGHALYDQGLVAEARESYRVATLLCPDKAAWKIRADTVCDYVLNSTIEIHKSRLELERVLDTYLDKPRLLKVSELVEANCEPPFNLTFHGLCNRSLKEKYGAVFSSAFTALPRRKPSGQPHLGFVVTRGHEGVFLRSMAGVIARLDPKTFRISVFGPTTAKARIEGAIARADIRFVGLPERLAAAAKLIESESCDVLYHWEISTDPLNYFLPYFGLAPIQCTSWGIQDTSGIPAMDYYVSSDLVETPDAQEHYSEKLYLLETLPTYQKRVQGPPVGHGRERYGFCESDHLYLCAQNLLKFHPDIDPLLAGILRRDSAGRVIITKGTEQEAVAARLSDRFRLTMPDVTDRIVFLPRQAGPDYLSLLQIADCMLDPPHFGGVNTTYDGFSLGMPIVTLPSNFQRGRYTFGCYRKMKLPDLVASSPAQYVEIAVRLGCDSDYRMEMKRRVTSAATVLFDDEQAVVEHQRFFNEVCMDARSA